MILEKLKNLLQHCKAIYNSQTELGMGKFTRDKKSCEFSHTAGYFTALNADVSLSPQRHSNFHFMLLLKISTMRAFVLFVRQREISWEHFLFFHFILFVFIHRIFSFPSTRAAHSTRRVFCVPFEIRFFGALDLGSTVHYREGIFSIQQDSHCRLWTAKRRKKEPERNKRSGGKVETYLIWRCQRFSLWGIWH